MIASEGQLLRTAHAAASVWARSEASWCWIALDGPLGGGKTTWVRGFVRCFDPKARVKSPTFPIVETIPQMGEMPGGILHVDAYRLASVEDVDSLDLEGMAQEASATLGLVEWSELVAPILGSPTLSIRLEHAGPARTIQCTAHDPLGHEMHEAMIATIREDR